MNAIINLNITAAMYLERVSCSTFSGNVSGMAKAANGIETMWEHMPVIDLSID